MIFPLSRIVRPAWDKRVFSGIGFDDRADERIWERIWTEEEILNFASTPMFLILAANREFSLYYIDGNILPNFYCEGEYKGLK